MIFSFFIFEFFIFRLTLCNVPPVLEEGQEQRYRAALASLPIFRRFFLSFFARVLSRRSFIVRAVLSDVLHVKIGLGVLTEVTGKNHAPQGWAGEGGLGNRLFFYRAPPKPGGESLMRKSRKKLKRSFFASSSAEICKFS